MFKERQGFLSDFNLTLREYLTNRRRALLVAPVDIPLWTTSGTTNVTLTTLIDAPGPDRRIVISALQLQSEVATPQTAVLNRGGVPFWRIALPAQGSGEAQVFSPGRELRLGVNEALSLTLSAATAVGFSLAYFIAEDTAETEDITLPPIEYLLRDNFSTLRSAGAINGTPADGTGQLRTVVDTGSRLSITANGLVFTNFGAVNDPSLRYPLEYPRENGLALCGRVVSASGNLVLYLGFDNDTTGAIRDGWQIATGLPRAMGNGAARVVLSGVYSPNTVYRCATILRSLGAWMYIKGGAFSEWTLAYVNHNANQTPEGAALVASAAVTGVGYVRRVEVARLPHWNSLYAGATFRRATTVAGEEAIMTGGDGVVEHTIRAATGVVQELMLRRIDDNNTLILRMDFTAGTIRLFQKIAGVETELTGGTTTQVWVNNAQYRIMVSLYGTFVRVTVDVTTKNDGVASGALAAATGVKVSRAGTELVGWPITPPGLLLADLDSAFPEAGNYPGYEDGY